MGVIDQALKANEQYAKTYDPKWGAGPPKPKIVVVTCMDPRLSDLPGILGLKRADIDVIRTGGPAVTEDVLAELIVSTRVLGSKEIMILNHTGCGFSDLYRCRVERQILQADRRRNTRPDALLCLQGPGTANQGADQNGQVASVDCKGCPGARFRLRRGYWPVTGGDGLFQSSGVILVGPTRIRSLLEFDRVRRLAAGRRRSAWFEPISQGKPCSDRSCPRMSTGSRSLHSHLRSASPSLSVSPRRRALTR